MRAWLLLQSGRFVIRGAQWSVDSVPTSIACRTAQAMDRLIQAEDPVRRVRDVVFEKRFWSRNCPKMFASGLNVEFFSFSPFGRGELYVTVSPWWIEFELACAMVVPTPPIFVYNFSTIIGTSQVYEDFVRQ